MPPDPPREAGANGPCLQLLLSPLTFYLLPTPLSNLNHGFRGVTLGDANEPPFLPSFLSMSNRTAYLTNSKSIWLVA